MEVIALMKQRCQTNSQDGHIGDIRLLAQAIVLLAFAAAAIAVGWLMLATDQWYVPALALIVAARFGYDHFFD